MKKVILTVVFLYFFSIFASFNLFAGNKAERDFKWKIDDLLTGDRVSEYTISDNGKRVVWVISRWDLKKQKIYNVIYLSSIEQEGKRVKLTRYKNRYSSVKWIPGNNSISFKTDRKFNKTPGKNLWRMDLNGGEPYPITEFKKGIQDYDWVDGNTIVYTSRESDNFFEMEKKRKKDTSVLVEDEEHRIPVRLFKYDLKQKKVKRLTNNKKPITSFFLSPKKNRLIYSVSLSMLYGQDQEIRPAFYLYDLGRGTRREIFKDRSLKPAGVFAWASDGSGFYSIVNYCTHPKYTMASVNKIFWFGIGKDRPEEIDLNWSRYAGWSVIPTKDGFIVPLLDGVHYRYARFYRRGTEWKRRWIEGEKQKNIRSLKIAKDMKTIIYSYSTASLPQKYFTGRLKGTNIYTKREIMKLNSTLFKKPFAKTEIVKWKGALDDDIEGILYYPLNYKKGKKYPLIVMIHGGPSGADMDFYSDRLAYPAHLMAERGAFSLKTNYHGSSNYGIKFGESIAGHYYEYEVPDIEKGVDYLIKRGMIDKDKLGIIGWSNGAILGTALNITTDRYKVASLGAGDVNWTSDYGNCAFGVAFDNYYFGGPPWEMVDTYIKKSPLFKVKKIKTPTLIFHGSLDRSVPYEQGWEYYRALKVVGKVPVRFISFPGEGHGPRKLAHQRRKLREEIDWFDRYLFKTYKEKNEALKKGSPLDTLSKLMKIKKFKGVYGLNCKDMLVPETVIYKKIEVGRFEVTRAQWTAFDKKYKYEEGRGDLPVTGISFKKAVEYSKWLSEITGKKFRLPNEDEAEKLYGKRSGNIFDYWAGYKLNPDDYKKLKKEIDKYSYNILLKRVGSFKPEGKEYVYDLGGNAAEWVFISAEKGKPYGGSAERPADETIKIEHRKCFTGFRIVKEK